MILLKLEDLKLRGLYYLDLIDFDIQINVDYIICNIVWLSTARPSVIIHNTVKNNIFHSIYNKTR